MEGSNLEILQRLFASSEGVNWAPIMRAWLEGDTAALSARQAAGLDAWAERLDAECVFDATGVEWVDADLPQGLEGWRALWSRWLEGWDHYSWTLSNWSEVGEHVIFDLEVHAIGSTTGAEVTWRPTQVWTVRDGKLIRLALFKDRVAALTAIQPA